MQMPVIVNTRFWYSSSASGKEDRMFLFFLLQHNPFTATKCPIQPWPFVQTIWGHIGLLTIFAQISKIEQDRLQHISRQKSF